MSRICMNNCSGIDSLLIPVMESEKWACRRRNGRFAASILARKWQRGTMAVLRTLLIYECFFSSGDILFFALLILLKDGNYGILLPW